jgi:hypothetical protein
LDAVLTMDLSAKRNEPSLPNTTLTPSVATATSATSSLAPSAASATESTEPAAELPNGGE